MNFPPKYSLPRYRRDHRLKIVIVAPIMARYDAISAATRDTYRALAAEPDMDVVVLTWRNDYPEVNAQIISDLPGMLMSAAFLRADLILYHFGIYAPLFDAMLVGNGQAHQIARFHNITPARFLRPSSREIIEKSFLQIENMLHVDEIWADSVVNKEELISRNFDPSHIRVVPLAVDAPGIGFLGNKPPSPIELLFVGRIVPSKGVHDLVRAVAFVRQRIRHNFRLKIVGNREWSDPDYLVQVETGISANHLDDVVEIVGTVDDAALSRLYQDTHAFVIPSYHEGFCKPLVEALRAGCIPVGYASYNLPYITNGLGRLVPPGAVDQLALALEEVINGVASGMIRPNAPLIPLDRGSMSVSSFDVQAKNYVTRFSHEQFSRTIVRRVRDLCGRSEADAGAFRQKFGCGDSFISGAMQKQRTPLSLFLKDTG